MKRRLAAGALMFAVPAALAADHALVLTIAQYANAPALPGVLHDRDNATRLAARLGFAAASVLRVNDAALDVAGLDRQLAELAVRVQPGDRVFVYWSGHGTSRTIEGGACEQGLLAHDGQPYDASRLAAHLGTITGKAAEVVVVIDACHAGGLAQGAALRSAALAATGLRPKFAAVAGNAADAADAADACAAPVNIGLPLQRRGAVNLELNHVLLAAARADEVAFDHAERGGLATSALVGCLDAAPSAISFAELATCAQAAIERSTPKLANLRPQHLVLAGNGALRVAAAGLAQNTPPQQQIERLLSAADKAWGLVLTTPQPVLRIGRDALALTLTSDRDGRFAIYYLGSDGRALTRLYPTRAGEANQLRAGVPFTIPRRWRSQGPAGNNRLVAVAVQEGGDELAVLANLSDTPPSSYAAATLDVAEAP